jgi:methyltransferase FkbM-like protein
VLISVILCTHNLRPDYLEETVECTTFERILASQRADRLDLLQIDAEGSDAELLALFPFESVRPPSRIGRSNT